MAGGFGEGADRSDAVQSDIKNQRIWFENMPVWLASESAGWDFAGSKNRNW